MPDEHLDPYEFFTIDQVAKLLKVSKSTVRRVIKDGSLPAVRCRERCVRVAGFAIDNFIRDIAQGIECRRENERAYMRGQLGIEREASS